MQVRVALITCVEHMSRIQQVHVDVMMTSRVDDRVRLQGLQLQPLCMSHTSVRR